MSCPFSQQDSWGHLCPKCFYISRTTQRQKAEHSQMLQKNPWQCRTQERISAATSKKSRTTLLVQRHIFNSHARLFSLTGKLWPKSGLKEYYITEFSVKDRRKIIKKCCCNNKNSIFKPVSVQKYPGANREDKDLNIKLKFEKSLLDRLAKAGRHPIQNSQKTVQRAVD